MRKPFQRYPFFIRLLNWEYWPFNVVYFPMFCYYLWQSVKARSPLFFSAANPGIPTGGLIGESKLDILNMLPNVWKPVTVFIPESMSPQECLDQLRNSEVDFPLVAKPDVGERGLLVAVLNSAQELSNYRALYPVDFLLQEYITHPDEVSILYYRFPGADKGNISSVTLKRYLSVTGNGRDTVWQLIAGYPRARLQENSLQASHGNQWNQILPEGEVLQFHTIGNHSKGCMFLDGRGLITPQLVETFDVIHAELKGIHYCRYDIKCASWEALEQGRDFKILEINGVKSEPAHIYDPDYPIPRFYRDIFWHWDVIYRISKVNNQLGIPYIKVSEALGRIRTLWAYHKKTTVQIALPLFLPWLATLLILSSCAPELVKDGRSEGPLRKGLKNGTWIGYHFNGNKEWQGNYRLGKPVGNWQTWYENGERHESFRCRDSLRDGKYQEWYPEGFLKTDGAYEKGLLSGTCIQYYSDGSFKEKGSYQEGKKNGLFQSFYPNGRMSGQFNWSLDKGEGAGFHPNGEVSYTATWIAGKPDGLWKYFDEQGRLSHEELYRDGVVISSY